LKPLSIGYMKEVKIGLFVEFHERKPLNRFGEEQILTNLLHFLGSGGIDLLRLLKKGPNESNSSHSTM